MAESITLEATKRQVTGKEVKHLRAEGIIPAVLYGPTFDPIHLQVPWTDLRLAMRAAGGSQVIELSVDGETYNALIRDVQRSPVRREVIHIDFYRVRMDVAIRTDVQIVLVGDQERFFELGGTIIQEMNAIEVEALPGDLPPDIQVDLSPLQEIGDTIVASDLPKLEGVTYMVEPDDIVVTTTYLRLEEEEEEEEEEEVFEEGAEPELIRRRDEDEEGDEDEV